jgi:phage N-6-adenine-methyltransferase
MKGQSALFSSKSDEWSTPKDLFEKLNRKFGFLMDVAASHENALCDFYYTKDENTLIKNWESRNFCNPPYSNILAFVEKAHQEALDGKLTVMLIPARTDTRWFHNFIKGNWHVEYLKGRLKFGDSKNSAPFPSMIVYFGIAA